MILSRSEGRIFALHWEHIQFICNKEKGGDGAWIRYCIGGNYGSFLLILFP